MNLTSTIKHFWQAFLSEATRDPDTAVYEVFHFADNEADANKLADLVLQGRKLATASLLWEYESSGKRQPRAGDLSIVTDWEGIHLCVIETLDVEVRAFEDVDQEFAAAEGEGDSSLKYWRDSHWKYFRRVCRDLGRQSSYDMPVVCERFRVVFPQKFVPH